MSLDALKPAGECRFDLLALGEVMLRFDPGEGRIRTARSFNVWEGGGEYNVARALKRCFGYETSIVTGIADNELGLLLQDLIYQGGVDQGLVKWFESDGIGRNVRNGLNFTERGFGVRGALGCSDRGLSATSQIAPGDIDWMSVFGQQGVRWFHTGGIYASLSDQSLAVTIEAMKVARACGTLVSYDLNYRPSLWAERGGLESFQAMNQSLAPYIDVLIGFPGFMKAPANLPAGDTLNADQVTDLIADIAQTFPSIQTLATTLREAGSASRSAWSAVCLDRGERYQSVGISEVDILDRVGGGDGFAAGFFYGLMEQRGAQTALEYGNALGALAMTTPGDQVNASKAEVEAFLGGAAGQTLR